MFYKQRNLDNINKLAPNTKAAALKWHQYCIDNGIDILIYETIRTKEKQAQNVKTGKSQTMQSYHLVGQALDFVPVLNKKGDVGWTIDDYTRGNIMEAINYAKSLGFTWGGDWDNDGNWRDETFLDAPHLQFNYKGYGTDKTLEKESVHHLGKSIAQLANEVLAGKHGNGEERKKSLGSAYSEVQKLVTKALSNQSVKEKTIAELAKEVLAGKHGNGRERMLKLGSNYAAVQAEVTRLMRKK